MATTVQQGEDVPEFRILSVGMKGSGKSVFLATLYKSAMAWSETRGYSLFCRNPADNARLLSTYSQIQAVDEPFPPISWGVTEYCFNAMHPKSEKPFFRFKYTDYPGGALVGEVDCEGFEISEQISISDSILVLLDGRKVFNSLSEKKEIIRGKGIGEDISVLASFLNLCVDRNKPVHIVVTKFDILKPLSRFSIENIWKLILSNDDMADVLKKLCRSAPVRLIPVSSVGGSFVNFDEVLGDMNKRPDGRVSPLNVELALTCAICDHLRSLSTKGDPRLDAALADKAGQLKVVNYLRGWTGRVIQWSPLLLLFSALPFTRSIVYLGVRAIDSVLSQKAVDVQHIIDSVRAQIKDGRSAFIAVCALQAAALKMFEDTSPRSKMTIT